MRLIISGEAVLLGLANAVAASVHGLQQEIVPGDQLAGDVRLAEELAAADSPTAQQRLNIAEAKAIFSLLGYPDQVPAGQRLIQSFRDNGFKRLGDVVDAANVASIESGLGIGLHANSCDINEIRVERSAGERRITPIFQSKSRPIPNGDLIYSCPDGVMAWLGRKDVDAEPYRFLDTTNVAIIVALGHAKRSRRDNTDTCGRIFGLIRKQRPSASINVWETVKD